MECKTIQRIQNPLVVGAAGVNLASGNPSSPLEIASHSFIRMYNERYISLECEQEMNFIAWVIFCTLYTVLARIPKCFPYFLFFLFIFGMTVCHVLSKRI